jgi:hypothetical protein
MMLSTLILLLLFISLGIPFIITILAKHNNKPAQKLCCSLGWHSYPCFIDAHNNTNDPYQFLTYAKCKYCGYEGQIDSQGNLF